MIASLLNFYRRRIHRHPAATTRRVEAERAREARIRKDSEERQRCLMLAQGIKRMREERAG